MLRCLDNRIECGERDWICVTSELRQGIGDGIKELDLTPRLTALRIRLVRPDVACILANPTLPLKPHIG